MTPVLVALKLLQVNDHFLVSLSCMHTEYLLYFAGLIEGDTSKAQERDA